jgi:hypothetical protein
MSELNEDQMQDEVQKIYTALSTAKDEIWRRWNDASLRKKAEDFLGGDIPEVFRGKPKAIIFRNIATPNFELKLAVEYAEILELDLVVVEYTADKFCTRNRDKLHLGKMLFLNDNAKGACVTAKKNIISIKEMDNVRLSEIKTIWNENLIDFHHRILQCNGYKNIGTFDASIYKESGLGPYEVYLKIFGFCSHFSVLLENFLVKTDKGERNFTQKVILPAFHKVSEMTGERPMIVPLLSVDEEESINWQYYPDEIKDLITEV